MRKLIALILIGLVAGCSGETDNSEPPALLTSIKNPIGLDINWQLDTRASTNRAAFRLRPLIVGDRVYSIDTSGLVRGIDLASGRRLWRHKSGYEPIIGLGGNSQLLLVTSRNGDLAAFREIEDGLEPLWDVNLGSEIRAIPIIDNGQIFVRSVDGRLRSLSVEDGSQQWQITGRVPALSLTGNSNPLVSGDLVISGFDDGKLIAYNRDTGKSSDEHRLR